MKTKISTNVFTSALSTNLNTITQKKDAELLIINNSNIIKDCCTSTTPSNIPACVLQTQNYSQACNAPAYAQQQASAYLSRLSNCTPIAIYENCNFGSQHIDYSQSFRVTLINVVMDIFIHDWSPAPDRSYYIANVVSVKYYVFEDIIDSTCCNLNFKTQRDSVIPHFIVKRTYEYVSNNKYVKNIIIQIPYLSAAIPDFQLSFCVDDIGINRYHDICELSTYNTSFTYSEYTYKPKILITYFSKLTMNDGDHAIYAYIETPDDYAHSVYSFALDVKTRDCVSEMLFYVYAFDISYTPSIPNTIISYNIVKVEYHKFKNIFPDVFNNDISILNKNVALGEVHTVSVKKIIERNELCEISVDVFTIDIEIFQYKIEFQFKVNKHFDDIKCAYSNCSLSLYEGDSCIRVLNDLVINHYAMKDIKVN